VWVPGLKIYPIKLNKGYLRIQGWVTGFTMEQKKCRRANPVRNLMILLMGMFLWEIPPAESGHHQIEREMLGYIETDEFRALQMDRHCQGRNKYRIYLIDNFDLKFDIVPGVRTSHGEMVLKLLKAGRNDIEVTTLNTSLCKGLAQVINEIVEGACVDAVISAVPGSNYTYEQISSLFGDKISVNPDNIKSCRNALISLLQRIAFDGFPSVEWLEGIDANSVKLSNDARKFVFVEALGRFNVPVFLPYGNLDATYRGKVRSVNLLSHYTAARTGEIPYLNHRGSLSFAPSLMSQTEFRELLAQIERDADCRIEKEIVLTASQYRHFRELCPAAGERDAPKSYVWLNASEYGKIYHFDACCVSRGEIIGTSLIPPLKVKELLVPKDNRD
jgi:hypothetical protein